MAEESDLLGQDWAGRARMAGGRMAAEQPLDELDEEALRRHPDEARMARMALRIRKGEIDPDQI